MKKSKTQRLNELKSRCEACFDCELGKTRGNIVFADGNPISAKAVLIGEAPGANEDIAGIPFVGRAGKLLNEFLDEVGISREKDLYIINTLKCRPPENREPSRIEKNACEKFLLEQIEIIQPKLLIFCGATALKSFYTQKTTISKIRGQWLDIPLNGRQYKAMAIFHPSYLLRNHRLDEGAPRFLMRQDLKNIFNYISA